MAQLKFIIMSKATIKVEFDPVSNIRDAFVKANKNGIVDIGIDNYNKELSEKNGFKFTVS